LGGDHCSAQHNRSATHQTIHTRHDDSLPTVTVRPLDRPSPENRALLLSPCENECSPQVPD
jgi:hypothetical protein